MQLAADMAVASAWLFVLAHNLLLGLRGRRRRAANTRLLLGLGLLLAIAAMGVRLERLSGRLLASDAGALAGALLALAGAWVHVHARYAIGPAWSSGTAPVATTLVEVGPYRVVRHPLYAGILLLALGTVVAHPSVATICGASGIAIGLAAKITREERALAAAFGPAWAAYRRRVPALVPRIR